MASRDYIPSPGATASLTLPCESTKNVKMASDSRRKLVGAVDQGTNNTRFLVRVC